MHPAAALTVEDHVRAQLICRAGGEGGAQVHRPVPVALRYDPAGDSRSVRFAFPGAFPGGPEWTFTRDLLETGLRTPAGHDAVRVWPCGRVQTVLEFHSADAVAVVQFDSAALMRFLRRTYAAEESGQTGETARAGNAEAPVGPP